MLLLVTLFFKTTTVINLIISLLSAGFQRGAMGVLVSTSGEGALPLDVFSLQAEENALERFGPVVGRFRGADLKESVK